MIFTETPISGAFIIQLEALEDTRGSLTRTFCEEEFAAQGLNTHWVQCSTVYNNSKGTLRGMHYQMAPHEEIKLVRCTAGAVYDVIVDLRPESQTFNQWFSIELSAVNRLALYIPKRVAHGMKTLLAGTELFYMMSNRYHSESATGVRWNDPAFNIDWQLVPESPNIVISEKDLHWSNWIA